MKIQEVALRRSIRKFRRDEVPEGVLRDLLEAARLAPSAKNAQPWRFLVMGPESRTRMLEAMESSLRSQMNIVDSGRRTGIAGALHTFRVMKNAPLLIGIVRPDGSDPRGNVEGPERIAELLDAMSVGAAVENLLLEAQAHGLGTLWIGNTFLAYDALCDALGIQGQLLGAVAVGYADEVPEARPRKSMDEIAEFLP